MKLSIIIPYYNTLELTKNLLDALTPQLSETEVILVSHEDSKEQFKEYPIKFAQAKRKGVSRARNEGLRIASGSYVTFVDSDDLVVPDYVSAICSVIDSHDFDYCTFGWKSTLGDCVVTDRIPNWNTSVWNCIYKREVIGQTRFNENKQIAEDKDFNLLVRKGKSHHINKILYIYNNQREDSLTKQYSRGEISMNTDIKAKIVIYRTFLSLIGGIETAIYNLCSTLHDKYDITFIYDTADPAQLFRLKKLVKCVKYTGQKIDCDKFIMYGFNPSDILEKVTAKEIIQQVCCDIKAVDYRSPVHPRVTKIFADSKHSANVFNDTYSNSKIECEVLHNVFIKPKYKRVLRLMTASRLSWEKGYDRMKVMAKRMHELKIPFAWEVFTNDKPNENIDGMIFRKPRLDIAEWMQSYDYGVQLSETESWCCTATEFLLAGTQMILTDFESAKEQVIDNENGYILKRDMSNLDEILKKMCEKKFESQEYRLNFNPEFTHESEWKKLLGKGSKSDYVYDDKGGVIVKAVQSYTDVIENRHISAGEYYEVSPERLEVLLGNNAQHTKYVEVMN